MKRIIFLFTAITMIAWFISCKNAENKADSEIEKDQTDRPADQEIKDNDPAPATSTGTGTADDTTSNKKNNNDILAKIDQHLVSKASYPPSGGIINATVTVRNTLSDITFQKAIVQVSTLDANGTEMKSDFYTIQNLEPNDVETIKIPNDTRGVSLKARVVKVKSNQLTNGEMVLTGAHLDGNK